MTLPAPGAAPSTGTLRSADGTAIAWQRTGEGPPTVLLHGTSADRTSWALATPLLARTLTTIAYDRRGRGDSGDGVAYALAREVEDLRAVVAWLDGPPHVVAHSYGAVVALAAMAEGLEVRSLVAYEPPLAIASHVDVLALADACDAALARGDREGVARTFFTAALGDDSLVDALRAVPPVFARLLANAHTIPREVRAAAGFGNVDPGRITAPTLVLLGGASPGHFAEAARSLHERLPDSRLDVLPGQGHLAHAQRPDLFADLVLAHVRATAD